MLTKAVLFALVAACGVSSTSSAVEPPDEPGEFAPPDDDEVFEGQHFCCQDIDTKTWTGDDCVLISEQQVALCPTVLYCPGKWGKKDGKVTCE